MATARENRAIGAVLVGFGACQYAITAQKVWKSSLPTWWVEHAIGNGAAKVFHDPTFPYTVIQLLSPIILIAVGISLVVAKSNSMRSWNLRLALLGSIVALAASISAWKLALFAPLMAFYLLAMLWVGVRTYPRVSAIDA